MPQDEEDPLSPVALTVRAAQFVKARLLMPLVLAMAERGRAAKGEDTSKMTVVIADSGSHVQLGTVELVPPMSFEDAKKILNDYETRRRTMTQDEKLLEAGFKLPGFQRARENANARIKVNRIAFRCSSCKGEAEKDDHVQEGATLRWLCKKCRATSITDKAMFGDPTAPPLPDYGKPKWLEDKKITCSCGAVYTLETLPEQCTGTREGRRCTVGHFGKWARVNANIKAAAERGHPELEEEARKIASMPPKQAADTARDMVRAVAAEHGLPPPEEVERRIAELRAQGLEGEALGVAIDRMAQNDLREAIERASPCSCRDDLEDPMRKRKCPRHGVAPWLRVTWLVGERL